MGITITPLSDHIGAEISGVDLSQPLDSVTVKQVHKAWLDHLVILFRDQHFSEEDQIRFGGYFGELQTYPRERWSPLTEYPDSVLVIGNIMKDGELAGTLPDGELTLHADSMWFDIPPKATTLYAIEVPKKDGETYFASMYAAYDALPDRVKEALKGQEAVYSYNIGARYLGDEMGMDEPVSNTHPPVVTHPETGKKMIFVNSLMTKRLEGMAPDASAALLEEVYAATRDTRFQYLHDWRPGDFLMWDNRCSQHGRNDFDHSERRLLKRVTVKGDVRPTE